MSKRNIIWDWNGTLLNDLVLSVDSINTMLKERNLNPISIEHYKEIFVFPVVKYYEACGFDFNKEDFEIPAMQFITLYQKSQHETELFSDVMETLNYLKEKNYRQFVLSAMEDGNLNKMLSDKGISNFFEDVRGIQDNYAREKVSMGKKLMQDFGLLPEECIMIGDTLHDAEVAEICGMDCILFSGGHVSRQRLEKKNHIIIDKLSDLTEIL